MSASELFKLIGLITCILLACGFIYLLFIGFVELLVQQAWKTLIKRKYLYRLSTDELKVLIKEIEKEIRSDRRYIDYEM